LKTTGNLEMEQKTPAQKKEQKIAGQVWLNVALEFTM
jgi:hypothetical protein